MNAKQLKNGIFVLILVCGEKKHGIVFLLFLKIYSIDNIGSIFSYLELPFLFSIVINFPVCQVLPQDEI